jgi:hypothetical protein
VRSLEELAETAGKSHPGPRIVNVRTARSRERNLQLSGPFRTERWISDSGTALSARGVSTCAAEGSVTNQRLLQDLVGKGHLLKDGYGRWASYRLPDKLVRSGRDAPGETETPQEGSQHSDGSSQHNHDSSQHNDDSSQHTDPVLDGAELLAIGKSLSCPDGFLPPHVHDFSWEQCQACLTEAAGQTAKFSISQGISLICFQ